MEHPGETTEAAHLGWIYLLILHFLHGFLHFLELLHHTVDVLDLHASAVSDTLSAAAVQNLDIRSFLRCHGKDDSFDVLDFLAVKIDILQLILELAHPRDHAQNALERAELSDLLELLQEIIESELTLPDLSCCILQRILIHISLCGFDQSLEIAQIEDTSCHTVRMEIFQPAVELFGYADHLDRFARYALDGKSSAASGIAIHLRQDGPVNAQALIESLCRIDSVLTSHGVEHQKDLLRMNLSLDISQLGHQLFIDR